jgi:tripartite-type tricarboxylate transporter receptor subunit TctC
MNRDFHSHNDHGNCLVACLPALLFATASTLSTSPAKAQAYPARPIRIIVPFTPGTGIDLLARVAGPKLSERWAQSVVIDNRPGASGNIGTDAVAKSAPDGLTLMVTANTFAITPVLAKTPFDPVRDFTPVTQMATGTMALSVHPSLPVTSVAALIALAKARPGALNYASPGSGTPQHMAAELFKLVTGTQIVHVPYKGSAGAVADVVGGQVPVMFMPMHTALPQVAAKRLRILAQSGPERSPAAPEYPTFDQAGVRGVEVGFWYGMLGPAAIAQDIVAKLNGEIAAIWQLAEVREGLRKQGLEPVTSSPAQFAQLIRGDLKKWERVVKEARIAAD